jgi:hypothetical protein
MGPILADEGQVIDLQADLSLKSCSKTFQNLSSAALDGPWGQIATVAHIV